jgi:hypothetical protein
MLMQTHTDTPPLSQGRAAGRRWRQAAARSGQTHRDVPETDKADIGRDAFALYNHGGTVAVASVWLVIYVIAALYGYIAWSLSFVPLVR